MLRFFGKPQERLPTARVTAYGNGRVHFVCEETLAMGDQDLLAAVPDSREETGRRLVRTTIRVEEYFADSDENVYTGLVLGSQESIQVLEEAFPPARPAASSSDRRRAPRKERVCMVSLVEPPQGPAVAIDLSVTGMRLGCTAAIQPGERVQVRVESPPLLLCGEARWSRPHPSGNFEVGVALTPLPPQQLGMYKRMIEGLPMEDAFDFPLYE
ncbi:MAG: PilZ domain-containing protein [Candidatus Eremiobacterota bacterium]